MLKSLALIFAGAAAYAASLPCTSASLRVYDTGGFSCSEDNILFSNFTFVVSGTEVPPLTASAVGVSPLDVGGLEFNAGFAVPAGMAFDVVIAYTETISSGTFAADTLAISGVGQSGTGSVDVAESVCIDAPFNAAGICPAATATLNVFVNASGSRLSDSVALAASTLGIVKDIAVSGGTGLSSAGLSLIDNSTPSGTARVGGEIPEPEARMLIGLGLVLITIAIWRRKNDSTPSE